MQKSQSLFLVLLAILSGVFIGTSYIPFTAYALFFCMVPLWSIWLFQSLSPIKVFFYGWITQFVLALIGFHWVYHTAVEFGHLHPILALLILFLFCATQNLHIPLAGLLWKYFHHKMHFTPQSSLFFLAIATSLLERLYPMMFYWNLGYPWFWMDWPAYQWADTIGFEGLSLLTFLINAQILWIGMHIRWRAIYISIKKSMNPKVPQNAFLKNKKIIYGHLVFLIFLIIFLNVTGNMKKRSWADTDRTLHVGVVQANIGSFDKYMAYRGHSSYQPQIYQQYFNLTQDLLRSSAQALDILIWPETAFPDRLDASVDSINKLHLKNFIARHQIPLLTGAYSGDWQDPKPYNALFLFDKDGLLLGKYRKSILLAFGEYFPGANTFPILKKWFPQVSHFSVGPGPQTWEWQGINIGTQICYEGLDPRFSAHLAQKGSQIIVNVTNDSWFGHTFQPYQHLYMTLARAIEIRRPIIRVTNTGITSAITADGTLLQQSPQQRPWAGRFVIPYTHQPYLTAFTRFEKFIPLLQLALLVGITFLKRHFLTRIGIVIGRRRWGHIRYRRRR